MSLFPIIQVKNLNVTYFKGKQNQVRALKNISLDIFPGEFVIFFGPSGCGKSTLLYAIAALEREIEGDIIIERQRLQNMSRNELERYHQTKIGMVFQAYYLLPSLSVLDNVILPQMAIGAETKKREKSALSLLRRFGVYEQRYKVPQELSGGQQQRIAICRALINNPQIILADEPMGNLDSRSASEVIGLLQQLNRREKKTVILVTHDPSHLHIADRVFYLKDGQLVTVKENKPTVRQSTTSPRAITKDQHLLQQEFKDLRHISNPNQLESFQVERIALEVLAGLSWQELEHMKEAVSSMLLSDSGYEPLFDYLNRTSRDGGMDLDSRTAQRIANEMKRLMTVVRSIRGTTNVPSQVEAVASYLQDYFNIRIKGEIANERFRHIITERLTNRCGIRQVREQLDAPIRAGGLGLEARQAYRIAKRLELILLSRFRLEG